MDFNDELVEKLAEEDELDTLSNGLKFTDNKIVSNDIEYLASSSDQYFDVEPELLGDRKSKSYIWVLVNYENVTNEIDDSIENVDVEFSFDIDEEGLPTNRDEQFELGIKEIPASSLNFFSKKLEDVKEVVKELAKEIYKIHTGNDFPEKISLNIKYTE